MPLKKYKVPTQLKSFRIPIDLVARIQRFLYEEQKNGSTKNYSDIIIESLHEKLKKEGY